MRYASCAMHDASFMTHHPLFMMHHKILILPAFVLISSSFAVIKMNQQEPLVIVNADHFIDLIKEKNDN